MLTPDDVRNVVFSGAWRKERGYDEAEVDRFLARVEATLRGKRLVTARDVLTAQFSPRKKGARAYKKSQVDKFLDKVALTLMKLEVRDDDVPRRHRLETDGEPPTRSSMRARMRAEEAPPEPAEPPAPAPEPPAAQPEPQPPRRPERPDPEATRAALPQRQSRPPQATGPTPAPAPPPPAPAAIPAATSAQMGPASATEMVRDPARFGALEPAKSQSTALDKGEVDAFMDRVQATLRGADAISSHDVLNARFNPPAPGMPGYDKEGVIAFLKVVSVSIHNITSRNLRPVNAAAQQNGRPAATQQNGIGQPHGRPPQPAADQRPTSTNIPPVDPGTGRQPTPANGRTGAFPAQLSGKLNQQDSTQRG